MEPSNSVNIMNAVETTMRRARTTMMRVDRQALGWLWLLLIANTMRTADAFGLDPGIVFIEETTTPTDSPSMSPSSSPTTSDDLFVTPIDEVEPTVAPSAAPNPPSLVFMPIMEERTTTAPSDSIQPTGLPSSSPRPTITATPTSGPSLSAIPSTSALPSLIPSASPEPTESKLPSQAPSDSSVPSSSPTASSFALTILHMNDHRSRLEDTNVIVSSDDFAVDVDEAAVNVTIGGFPRLATAFEELANETESGNVLKLHAGGSLLGSMYYTLYQGEADAQMMQQVCFDAVTLGQFDFYDGEDVLADFISEMQSAENCSNHVVSSNLIARDNSPLLALQANGSITTSVTFRFDDGNDVGVIAIQNGERILESVTLYEDTDFHNVSDAVTYEVAALEDMGVDKIVVLSNMGYEYDVEVLSQFEGIDVIVSGGSHTLLGDAAELGGWLPEPSGDYPTIVGRPGPGMLQESVCIVSAWEYAHALGQLNVDFDLEGNVQSCDGHPVIPFQVVASYTATERDAIEAALTSLGPVWRLIEPDVNASLVLDSLQEDIEEIESAVVAVVDEDLCYERTPGEGASEICRPLDTLQTGGDVPNLVAQAFLAETPEADFALINTGSVVGDMYQGNFTVRNVYDLLPHHDTLVLVQMTGEEIMFALEDMIEAAVFEGVSSAYPYGAGIRFDVNIGAPVGERCSNIQIGKQLSGSWYPLRIQKNYTLVVTSLLIFGGDESGILEWAIEDAYDTHSTTSDAFLSFANNVTRLTKPEPEDFSTQMFIDQPPTASPTYVPFKLSLLHMNDHHSHLKDSSFFLPIGKNRTVNSGENGTVTSGENGTVTSGENGTVTSGENGTINSGENLTESVVKVNFGGFARVASLFDSLETASNEDGFHVLKLHAGDALVGTNFYSLFGVLPDAAMMERMCFDAFTLGDHEFDGGDAELADFINLMKSTDCGKTAVLSSNLVPAPSSPLADLVLDGSILPHRVFRFDGELVGVIGITVRNETLTSSSPDFGTTLLDEKLTIQRQAEALTSFGINKIVLLSHIGIDKDIMWMAEIPGVDVIVGGHSHSLMGNSSYLDDIFDPEIDYPAMVEASDGRLVCVVQAWEYAHVIGQLDVYFNSMGGVEECLGTPMIPFEVDTAESEADIEAVTEYLEGLGDSFIRTSEDDVALSIIELFESQKGEKMLEVIANVPDTICYERIPGQGSSDICSAFRTANNGGGVGNLVSLAFLNRTKQADLAIINAGAARGDIPQGNFTREDALTLIPFNDTLMLFELTGLEILTILEDAVDFAVVQRNSGSYPYGAGIRFNVNTMAPIRQRLSKVEVNRRLESDWEPLVLSEVYQVVTTSYLAMGKDGFDKFALFPEDKKQYTFVDVQEAFLSYVENQTMGILSIPSLSTFSTQLFTAQAPTPAPTGTPFSLSILHINDHHSNLESSALQLDGEGLPPGMNESVTLDVGGFARLSSMMKEIEALSPHGHILKLHAGDALVGSEFFTFFQGTADSMVMAELCFDAVVLGNHEFDSGDDVLSDFLLDLYDRTDATCPRRTQAVSANLVTDSTSPLADVADLGILTRSEVIQYDRNNELVGVVGITVRNRTMLMSNPSNGTSFTDEREAAQMEVERLISRGVNKIVLLTHIGYEQDLSWMIEIDGVDVIVGGHSHSFLGNETVLADVEGPYPTVTQIARDGRMVCVVQAWENALALGQLDVLFRGGEVVSCSGAAVIPYELAEDLERIEEIAVTEYLEATGSFSVVKPDRAMARLIAGIKEELAVQIEEPVASVPVQICYERVPGQGRSEVCPVFETSSQGGGAPNLVAQSLLSHTSFADMALLNAGGVMGDILAGDFSYANVESLLPSGDTLVLVSLTGLQIESILESAVALSLSGTSGAYPYAAGLRYRVNVGAAVGQRVSSIEVNSPLKPLLSWIPLDPTAEYSVATNSFLARGGDGYTEFLRSDSIINMHKDIRSIFYEFAINEEVLNTPGLASFSTRTFTNTKTSLEPTTTPVPSGTPSDAPSRGPTIEPTRFFPTVSDAPSSLLRTSPYPECRVCGDDDMSIQNQCNNVTVPGIGNVYCRDIHNLGLSGDISEAMCSLLPTQINVICNCSSEVYSDPEEYCLGDDTQEPTPSPTTMRPTPSPTIPIPSNAPSSSLQPSFSTSPSFSPSYSLLPTITASPTRETPPVRTAPPTKLTSSPTHLTFEPTPAPLKSPGLVPTAIATTATGGFYIDDHRDEGAEAGSILDGIVLDKKEPIADEGRPDRLKVDERGDDSRKRQLLRRSSSHQKLS